MEDMQDANVHCTITHANGRVDMMNHGQKEKKEPAKSQTVEWGLILKGKSRRFVEKKWKHRTRQGIGSCA